MFEDCNHLTTASTEQNVFFFYFLAPLTIDSRVCWSWVLWEVWGGCGIEKIQAERRWQWTGKRGKRVGGGKKRHLPCLHFLFCIFVFALHHHVQILFSPFLGISILTSWKRHPHPVFAGGRPVIFQEFYAEETHANDDTVYFQVKMRRDSLSGFLFQVPCPGEIPGWCNTLTVGFVSTCLI